MKFTSFAAGCGITALVAVAAAGMGAASAAQTDAAPAVSNVAISGGNDNSYYYPQDEALTKEDLAWAEALSKLNYNGMTLAEFRDKAAPWQDETAFHRARDAYGRLSRGLETEDPLRNFVDGTLSATMDEASALHYKGSCGQWLPSFYSTAQFERKEDVFGDAYTVFSAYAGYRLTYTAGETVTVAQRDKAFADYRQAVEAFLEKRGEKALRDAKTTGKALEAELLRLDAKLSTKEIQLQTKLDSYEANDWT